MPDPTPTCARCGHEFREGDRRWPRYGTPITYAHAHESTCLSRTLVEIARLRELAALEAEFRAESPHEGEGR